MYFRLTEENHWIKSGKILTGLFTINLLVSLILLNFWYPAGQLPGPYDSWFNLSLCREWINTLSAFWHGLKPTYLFWPEHGLAAYSEPSPLLMPFYLLSNCVFIDPFEAYLGFIALLWSLNVVGAAFFAKGILKDWTAALLCGILFGWSNYFFAQIEHPNAFFWGFFFPAILFLNQSLNKGNWKYWMAFAFMVILQAYSSTTVLSYLFVVSILIVLFSWKNWTFQSMQWVKMLLTICMITFFIYPLINFYLFSDFFKEAYNPAVGSSASVTSNLHFTDFFHAAPGNIWLPSHPELSFSLLARIRSAYPGIILVIGALLMICRKSTADPTVKPWVFLLGISGFVLSTGSDWNIGDVRIPMPMKWFYDYAGDSTFLRTPIRAYFLLIMALSLASAYVISSRLRILSPVFLILYLIECVPWAAKGVPAREISPEQKQITAIQNAAAEGPVLHLPSVILSGIPEKQPYPDRMSREYIYDYWQTAHRLNSVNGYTGFLPYSRLQTDALLKAGKFDSLFTQVPIAAIVWHKQFVMQNEKEILPLIMESKNYRLEELYVDSAIIVFRVHRSGT